MTIRKLWLLLLMTIAVISISINALVLSILTNRHFNDYITENYQTHFDQIVQYSEKALTENDLSYIQMNMEMETHLIDPIIGIKLYDCNGAIIVDVGVDDPMMDHRIMNGMMGSHYDIADQESDHVELTTENKIIGWLDITRYSSIANSSVARIFKANLITNSIFSTVIVLLIAFIIGIFISRKMSRELIYTSKMAQNADLGIDSVTSKTKIYEIETIQKSLEDLKTRLKLKNKSRKILIDEMMHQARTPLTILKTHIEGFSDNMIEMTPDEIKICEDQIENITMILSNLSNMIDTESVDVDINIEEFELNSIIKQIFSGLKTQFDKKKINLQLTSNSKISVISDKYKLSQTIYNILTNAYKYTGENGFVKVSYSIDSIKKEVMIQIEDNGEGIKDKDINKIFEAYYSGDTEFKSEGEGLGLYFAKENIEKIQGRIQVQSNVKEGTKFKIYLQQKISNI